MSDYKYWLDISGTKTEDIDSALSALKTEGVVPYTLKIDFLSQMHINGEYTANLSTESLMPYGTTKCWDAEQHEHFFHNLSMKFPGVTFEFRGVNVDDPQNNMFLKAFRNGQYKEVWQDHSDLSERLPTVPWRPYGEKDAPEAEISGSDFRSVFVLTCVHETKYGVDSHTSLHPSREDALAHVEDVKKECDFEEDTAGEYFDYDIDEHVLDVSKFAPARDPEAKKTNDTLYLGVALDIPTDYSTAQNLDVLHHLADYTKKLDSIPWSAHKDDYFQWYSKASTVLSVFEMAGDIFNGGVEHWASKRNVNQVNYTSSEDKVYWAAKYSMESMLDHLVYFAREVLPLNNGRDNDALDKLSEVFKKTKIDYDQPEGHAGEVLATGAAAFENAMKTAGDYLTVVCQVYAQFIYKKLEQDLGYDPILPMDPAKKCFMDALVQDEISPLTIENYTQYWHDHPGARSHEPNMNYAVAYTDKDGSDFNGRPWVEEGFSSSEKAEKLRENFIAENSVQRSFVFTLPENFNAEDPSFEVTWEYAENHRVETAKDKNQTLFEFLGMTEAEFSAWIKSDCLNVLIDIVNARKAGVPFEEYKRPLADSLSAAKAKADNQAKDDTPRSSKDGPDL